MVRFRVSVKVNESIASGGGATLSSPLVFGTRCSTTVGDVRTPSTAATGSEVSPEGHCHNPSDDGGGGCVDPGALEIRPGAAAEDVIATSCEDTDADCSCIGMVIAQGDCDHNSDTASCAALTNHLKKKCVRPQTNSTASLATPTSTATTMTPTVNQITRPLPSCAKRNVIADVAKIRGPSKPILLKSRSPAASATTTTSRPIKLMAPMYSPLGFSFSKHLRVQQSPDTISGKASGRSIRIVRGGCPLIYFLGKQQRRQPQSRQPRPVGMSQQIKPPQHQLQQLQQSLLNKELRDGRSRIPGVRVKTVAPGCRALRQWFMTSTRVTFFDDMDKRSNLKYIFP